MLEFVLLVPGVVTDAGVIGSGIGISDLFRPWLECLLLPVLLVEAGLAIVELSGSDVGFGVGSGAGVGSTIGSGVGFVVGSGVGGKPKT